MILRACAAIGLLIVSPILADPAIEAAEPQPVVWQHWQPLIGTWKAQGKGSPGQGEGTFSFGYELQNRVIVRATGARPCNHAAIRGHAGIGPIAVSQHKGNRIASSNREIVHLDPQPRPVFVS